MGFINYVGICILIWLAVGFIIAIKQIYIDKVLSEDGIKKIKKDSRNIFPNDENLEKALELVSRKSIFIIGTMLLGGIAFIHDIIHTFSKKDDE